MCYYILFLLIY